MVKIRHWRSEHSMDHLVHNAVGDELLFVHRGNGKLFCDYGHLTFRQGDYINMPRGTLWRTRFRGLQFCTPARTDDVRTGGTGVTPMGGFTH